jgi:hypothetical protein
MATGSNPQIPTTYTAALLDNKGTTIVSRGVINGLTGCRVHLHLVPMLVSSKKQLQKTPSPTPLNQKKVPVPTEKVAIKKQ